MKVYFSDPKRQIAALKPFLGNRANLPPVRSFLFEAEPEGLYITATDQEVGLRVYHSAQVVKTGKVIVPESVVDLLDEEDVMTLSAEGKSLSVHCGGFSRQCPTLDAGEFPNAPVFHGENQVQIIPAALEQLLGAVRFISGDDTRTIDSLQIKWTPGENGQARVTATGTDGFRLCRSTVKGECLTSGAALITRRATAALRALTNRAGDDPVTLSVAGDRLLAAGGRDILWSSQRTGNYPDVSELLKSAQAAKVSGLVEARAFQKNVERSLKALMDEKDRKSANAFLTVGDAQLKIAFSDQEAGSGEAVLPFQDNGARPFTAAFNLHMLESVLSGLQSIHKGLDSCQLSLTGTASPMVIGATAPYGPVLVLVMPVVGT
jgi:DNA polymerase III sliding clamp (beta) subunit (PCNA family)